MQPDVYTARDIAAAARVPERLVATLLARGEIRSIASQLPAGHLVDATLYSFVAHDEAVRARDARLAEDAMDAHMEGAVARARTAYDYLEPIGFEVYGEPTENYIATMRDLPNADALLRVEPNHRAGFSRFPG